MLFYKHSKFGYQLLKGVINRQCWIIRSSGLDLYSDCKIKQRKGCQACKLGEAETNYTSEIQDLKITDINPSFVLLINEEEGIDNLG